MLPTTQEYKISLMIGQDSFRTLEGVEVIPNPNYPDEPWYSTGGLAIVFKLKLKDKLYALKCFYTEANERQERLGLIAAYLKQNPSPYFVDFTYLEDELWVETDNNQGQGYPVVLMEWVEGKTLDNYLEQICTQNNTPALKNLYFQFCNLAWWLQQQPIAHGDIKHDNLIVTPDGKLKLIDYDGVFVPALRGRKANEMGSPCYQHPKRDAYFFDKNLDDFSLLVLQITLLALQQQPKLFTEHYNGDGIILKDTDYQNFAQSSIKTILWQLPEVKIPLLLSQLSGNINNLNAIDLMPLLQDVAWINWLVGGQKDDKFEFERKSLKELVLKHKKWRELFINQVSSNYSLNEKLINKYENRWKWNRLSVNESLPWSMNLMNNCARKSYVNWVGMSCNIQIPWSIELIETFKNKLDMFFISQNEGVNWSIELIEKYRDKWRWDCLSRNIAVNWSEASIERCKDKLQWWYLSQNEGVSWSIELIEKYIDNWSWRDNLNKNEGLPWSIELLEKYKDKWSWFDLSCNKALPWSFELLKKYENYWDWTKLSWNEGLPWSNELIEKYSDKWEWNNLRVNKAINWSEDLIDKYKDKSINEWSWWRLSQNEGISWSIGLLEKYKDKWDWQCLSSNQSLPWSESLIDKYKSKWSFYNLSANKSVLWSAQLIAKYEDKFNWEKLSKNPQPSWSIELIKKYDDKWEWEELSRNEVIYEKVFQPLLNDEFIDEVMAEIRGTS